MQHFFDPHSVVVMGVSERPDNLARNIIINLRNFGYRGQLYAVGRQTGDPSTQMIVLYLESIGNGRRLMELARGSSKPIIVHKSNRGQASRAIALSHTAALAADDRIVSAALQQAGILRTGSFEDTVSVACGLALPPVRGNDLVIISRSGGHAVIAADVAEQSGFRLAPLSDEFERVVRTFNRVGVIAPTNPVDLGTIFDFDLYAQIVQECLQTLAPDAILLINTYSITETDGAHRLARRVEQIVRESGRPVALCVYTQGDDRRMLQEQIGLPLFGEIEHAVRGLAASRDRYRWQMRHHGEVVPQALDAPPDVKRRLSATGVVTTDTALEVCQAYGIPAAAWEIASNPDQAARAADRLGYPVALKVLAANVTHKSDVGGVTLGLANAGQVRRKAEALLRIAPPFQLMVQRMAGDGVEVILGGKRDPTFGPVVMFGLGGIHVEVLEDVAFRVTPLSRADAEEMIAEVRGKRLLDGVRGKLPVDRKALIQALLSLSRLLAENPCISEVDINPLVVLREGCVAVDARIVTG